VAVALVRSALHTVDGLLPHLGGGIQVVALELVAAVQRPCVGEVVVCRGCGERQRQPSAGGPGGGESDKSASPVRSRPTITGSAAADQWLTQAAGSAPR